MGSDLCLLAEFRMSFEQGLLQPECLRSSCRCDRTFEFRSSHFGLLKQSTYSNTYMKNGNRCTNFCARELRRSRIPQILHARPVMRSSAREGLPRCARAVMSKEALASRGSAARLPAARGPAGWVDHLRLGCGLAGAAPQRWQTPQKKVDRPFWTMRPMVPRHPGLQQASPSRS